MPVENTTELLTDQLLNINNYKDEKSYIETECKHNTKNIDEVIPFGEFEKIRDEIEKSKRISSKIKELLSAHFGSYKTSKAITHERKTTRHFYYTLNNEEEVLNFVNILNNNLTKNMFDTFCEKKELYSIKKGDKDKLQLCACYYEKMSHNKIIDYPIFAVEFYLIIGIRYHKIKKDKIGASIVLSKNPIICMPYNVDETFFGIFNLLNVIDKEKQQKFHGINYFVNKYLYINSKFRNFISRLFMYYGEEFNKPILKDVGRTIMKNGCFLPELSYNELISCHTPKDIINKFTKSYNDINLNYNKYDLNISWIIVKLLPYIDKRDYKILMNLYNTGIENFISLSSFFEGFNEINSLLKFIKKLYFNNVWNGTKPSTYKRDIYGRYFDDYFYQSVNMNRKVRLNISLKKFLQLHDEVSTTYRKRCKVNYAKIVKENSSFNDLENELLLVGDIKRMKTDTDLFEEGERQNNCVFSRLNKICNDNVSIFHWNFNNESITIQFSKSKDGKFYVDEMRAKYNMDCSAEAKEFINLKLKEINSRHSLLEGFGYIE